MYIDDPKLVSGSLCIIIVSHSISSAITKTRFATGFEKNKWREICYFCKGCWDALISVRQNHSTFPKCVLRFVPAPPCPWILLGNSSAPSWASPSALWVLPQSTFPWRLQVWECFDHHFTNTFILCFIGCLTSNQELNEYLGDEIKSTRINLALDGSRR